MPKLLFLLWLISTFSIAHAYAQPDALNDGPYVFYTSDSMVVKSIQNRNSSKKVLTSTFSLKQKNNIALPVKFSGNNNYNFSVKLKSQLQNEPSVWPMPPKLFVLSDVEGEFEALRVLLIKNKVMDKNYRWLFGKGHLIICGDLFDRGLQVTEQLWLLYKLEQDAVAAGGYVHVILGNHDIMNLSNDVRYVQPRYFENVKLMNMDYKELYDKQTELGRWLRTKNVVEKIGDLLCLHGGISPAVNNLELSVEQINARARPFYDKSEDGSMNNNAVLSTLFSGYNSPFWYRGYFLEPETSKATIDSTLKFYGVSKILVGHTIAPKNISWYYNKTLLGLDVDRHANKNQAVFFDGINWYVVNGTGKKTRLN